MGILVCHRGNVSVRPLKIKIKQNCVYIGEADKVNSVFYVSIK